MAIFVITAWCLSLIVLVSLSIDLEISYIFSSENFIQNSSKTKLLFQESISVLSVTLFTLYILLRIKSEITINLFITTSLFVKQTQVLAKVTFVFFSSLCFIIAFMLIILSMLGSMILLEMTLLVIWPIIVDKSKLANRLFLPSFALVIILAHLALLLGFQVLKGEDPVVFNCVLIPNLLLAAYIIKKYKEIRDYSFNSNPETYGIKEVELIQRFSPSVLSFLFIVNLAAITPIRSFNNFQNPNYSDLGNSAFLTLTLLGVQLAVPFVLKNCLPNKALTCSGIVLLVVSYCLVRITQICLESEKPLISSVFFNVSSNIISLAAIPVKSWNPVDYERILLNKTFVKVFTTTYICMGMVKTLVVFNLLLIDLDLTIRVLLTITCVLSTIVFILSVRIDKMIQKLAQVSSITVV